MGKESDETSFKTGRRRFMSDIPIGAESAYLTAEEQDAEQRRSQWAQRQALSRVYSIDDMRRFLRLAARCGQTVPTRGDE